ncbi:MAG: hypothetical protein R3F61_13510 [Myxococcota bacterium]
MISALLASASAGVVVGGALLVDTPSEAAAVGAQVSVVCEREEGFCWTGRFAFGADVRGNGFSGVTELGGLAIIPSTEVATIRFGGGVRGVHIQRDLPIVMQWEDPKESVRWGIVPQAFLQGELAWTPKAPLVTGATVGLAPWAGVDPACSENDSPQSCATWDVSFVASFWGRKTFGNGLVLQAGFGTLSEVGVGYRF